MIFESFIKNNKKIYTPEYKKREGKSFFFFLVVVAVNIFLKNDLTEPVSAKFSWDFAYSEPFNKPTMAAPIAWPTFMYV